MTMQYGAFFPTRDLPADRIKIRDWAQAAEEIGFDYIEVSDHVLGADREKIPGFEGPYDADDSFHETFTTIAYMAAITENVGFASGVLILPQRQTALVAKQAAQVDILCGGRLRLGVGVGWNPVEYAALGEDWSKRGRRQEEQVQLMNQYWTQRTVTFDGEFDQVAHAGVNPLPIQRPIPVWFGGGVDAVLRRAAKYGQGWIPLGNPGKSSMQMLEKLHGYLREEGRDPASFGVEAWIRHNLGGADDWRKAVDTWRDAGATHATFYTSGQGVGGLDAQIAEMRKFKDAMG